MQTKPPNLFDRIWEFKGGTNPILPEMPRGRMTATLKKDIQGSDGKALTTGTKVRVFTISRFGHACVTANLSDDCTGYDFCVGGSPDTRNPGSLEDYLTDVWVRLD